MRRDRLKAAVLVALILALAILPWWTAERFVYALGLVLLVSGSLLISVPLFRAYERRHPTTVRPVGRRRAA